MKRLATATVAAVMAAAPVMADLVFPSLSYRTGAYAANGIPFADGYADYFTLLNERDGGIGGVMTRLVECETGYNTEKGVECYEATKGEGSLVYQPLSTGITYQLIPKATADGFPCTQWAMAGHQRPMVRYFPMCLIILPTTGTARHWL